MPDRSLVLGVNLAGGTAYLALVEAPDTPVLDRVDRLAPAKHLSGAERLSDFSARAGQQVRDLGVAAIGVAHPLLYSGWKYADAFNRITLEAAFMLNAHELGLRFESVPQHRAAKTVGVPLKGLVEALPRKLGIDKTTHWQQRAPALLAALALGTEFS